MNKQYAQLKYRVEEDQDLSSDGEQSYLQFLGVSKLAKSHARISFKQSKGKLRDLNLRKVILLDSQSTISLFCNKQLITNICKAKKNMTPMSNGGSMSVDKIADIGENQSLVWFSEKAIANILSLKEAIARYQVTYNSEDMEFIIHRNKHGIRTCYLRCIAVACITTTLPKKNLTLLTQ